MISLHDKMVQWSDPIEILSANHIAYTIVSRLPPIIQTRFDFVTVYYFLRDDISGILD